MMFYYVSFEQIEGEEVMMVIDVYVLGVLFYEFFVGVSFFGDDLEGLLQLVCIIVDCLCLLMSECFGKLLDFVVFEVIVEVCGVFGMEFVCSL